MSFLGNLVILAGVFFIIRELYFLIGYVIVKSPVHKRNRIYVYTIKTVILYMMTSLLGLFNGVYLIYYILNRTEIHEARSLMFLVYMGTVILWSYLQSKQVKMNEVYIIERIS